VRKTPGYTPIKVVHAYLKHPDVKKSFEDFALCPPRPAGGGKLGATYVASGSGRFPGVLGSVGLVSCQSEGDGVGRRKRVRDVGERLESN
jgi:hypothetical protein